MPPANTMSTGIPSGPKTKKVLKAPPDIKMSGQRMLSYTLKDLFRAVCGTVMTGVITFIVNQDFGCMSH